MGANSQQPAQTYLQLRNRVLNLNPMEVGLTPTAPFIHVWGVIIDTGYDVGTATLVALADGTTSLYYSTGGGLLGSGEYAPVAEASKALVAQAENHLQLMSPTNEIPLPEAGQVRFTFLTYSGILTSNAAEGSLASGTHPLSPLHALAHETLAQLRMLAEKKQKQS